MAVMATIRFGLGNQMFSYAAAQALASRLNTELFLDTSWFKAKNEWYLSHNDKRHYSLDNFTISAKPASFLKFLKYTRPYQNVHTRLFSKRSVHLFDEAQMNYMPRIREITDKNVRLVGLFQSEKYFVDYAEQIRAEFVSKQALSSDLESILKQMQGTDSVSLHVRRGDYATAQVDNYLLDNTFYDPAIATINSAISSPHYFIFSDDPEWVQANMNIGSSTIVSGRGATDIQEMSLMSACKHNIIANSTFSWWGAWLNANPDKIVCAPKDWFRPESIRDTSDIVPESWIKI